MRNDARPIGGERSHQSPVVSHQPEGGNRESGIYRPRPDSRVDDKRPVVVDFHADDLVMTASDATLPTRI